MTKQSKADTTRITLLILLAAAGRMTHWLAFHVRGTVDHAISTGRWTEEQERDWVELVDVPSHGAGKNYRTLIADMVATGVRVPESVGRVYDTTAERLIELGQTPMYEHYELERPEAVHTGCVVLQPGPCAYEAHQILVDCSWELRGVNVESIMDQLEPRPLEKAQPPRKYNFRRRMAGGSW